MYPHMHSGLRESSPSLFPVGLFLSVVRADCVRLHLVFRCTSSSSCRVSAPLFISVDEFQIAFCATYPSNKSQREFQKRIYFSVRFRKFTTDDNTCSTENLKNTRKSKIKASTSKLSRSFRTSHK